MKTPDKYTIIAVVLAAVSGAISGCQSSQRIAPTEVAVAVEAVLHEGVERPVLDGQKVRCDMVARPVYPPEALRAEIPGVAVVRIVIGESGEPIDYAVVSASPTADFGDAALIAAKRWKYYPLVGDDGRPQVYVLEIPVRFKPGDGRRRGWGSTTWNGL